MRKPQRPDPPHILDYMARIKIEGINVVMSAHEKMHVNRMDMIMRSVRQ